MAPMPTTMASNFLFMAGYAHEPPVAARDIWSLPIRSEIFSRPADRAPHMGGRAVVEAQPLGRLLEMTADDIGEWFPAHHRVGIERIDVVHRDHARGHVPFVIA